MRKIFVILCISVLFFSCQKEENNQSAVKFAAFVDTHPFPVASQYAKATYNAYTKNIHIIGQNETQTQSISIELSPLGSDFEGWKVGNYDFDEKHVSNSEYMLKAEYVTYDHDGFTNWTSNWTYLKTGNVEIKYFSNKRIRGSFYFDLTKKNSNNTFDVYNIVSISGGSFDLKFNQ